MLLPIIAGTVLGIVGTRWRWFRILCSVMYIFFGLLVAAVAVYAFLKGDPWWGTGPLALLGLWIAKQGIPLDPLPPQPVPGQYTTTARVIDGQVVPTHSSRSSAGSSSSTWYGRL